MNYFLFYMYEKENPRRIFKTVRDKFSWFRNFFYMEYLSFITQTNFPVIIKNDATYNRLEIDSLKKPISLDIDNF